MADENEYVYRLGLDARDVRSAINTILSAVGDLDDQFATKTPRSIRKTESALADLLGQMKDISGAGKASLTIDDKKLLAVEKRQHGELAKLVTELRTAEKEYQRFLEGRLTGRGGGKGLGEYTSTDLQRMQRTAEVVGGRGSFVRDAGNAEREQVAGVRAQERAEQQVIKALQDEEREAGRANAAFRKGAQDRDEAQTRLAIRIQEQADAYAAKVIAEEQRVTREVEQQADRRHRARQAEFATTDAQQAGVATAATVQNQRRLAGSTVENLSGIGRANQRNSAVFNGPGTHDQRAAFDAEQAAGLRAYYQAQVDAQSATESANQAINEEYQRHLPRLRYALYDVSTALGIASAATLAAGSAVVGTAAEYQSLYAQVRRTSDILTSPSLSDTQRESAFASLRKDLVDLSTQIPVTFADITKIATLGNQLGIASSGISGFTRTVAQFSATTDVSVDEAATAFGRLSELLDEPDFRKIGDEIAYLGVKSVATESDIIKTASQLAVSGKGINLTTEDVLALSTSVASLGVKPEQARGTFIRAFSQIGAAVDGGGEKLNDIARIAGVSSEVFKQQFGAGGDSAYQAFLQFTRGLGTSSADINGNLASIGITAVRDRQTLGLLAQNGSRALEDLANASGKTADGFLEKAYGEQAQTVTARLQTLGNQVSALFDTIGSATTGPIAQALQVVQGFVSFLNDIAEIPAEQTMLGLGAALAIVAGFLGVAAAGGLRVYGAFLALQSVLIETAGSGSTVVAVLTQIATRMNLVSAETAGLIAANEGLAASNVAVAETGAAASAGTGAVGGAAARGVAGVSKLSGALGKAGLVGSMLALLLVLPAIGEGIQGIINDLNHATPGVDGLTAAVKGLNQVGADQAKQQLLDASSAFGENKRQYANVNGKVTEVSFKQGQALPGSTISGGQAAINQATTGQATLKGQVLTQGADVGLATTQLQTYDKTLASLLASGDQQGFNDLLGVYYEQMKKAGVTSKVFAGSGLTLTREALGTTGNELIKYSTAQERANGAMQDGEAKAQAFGSSLDAIFSENIGAFKITDDLEALGKAAVENGAQVAFGGAQMQTAIQDIYASSDDEGVIKGRLQSLYDGLLQLGYARPTLEGLSQAIASIAGPATDSKVSLASFSKGVDSARGKADEASKSIRQLSDYAGDLSAAFARSNELRFGNQEASDKLTKGFRDFRDAIKDSREELRKVRADLGILESDQATRKYQLDISNRFGDTATGAQLQAEIAKGNADIAAKKREVADARAKNSRELTGNSQGAIDNRAQFRDLLSNGQDVLTTMAKNGASQKDLEATADRLKKQLVDQGVQMGFRRKDLEGLAAGYDDYRKIIAKVPRDLTTTATFAKGPAEQALAEYNEKLKGIDGKTVTTTVVQQAISLADPTQAAAGGLTAVQRAQSIDDARASRGFRSGGYTGTMPRWQEAGPVHGDEYVLNSQGYRMFPRQMLEAANHGVAPQQFMVKASATLPSGATVSLSREDRAIMAAGGGSQAITVNADRFGSAMDSAFVRSNRRGDN